MCVHIVNHISRGNKESWISWSLNVRKNYCFEVSTYISSLTDREGLKIHTSHLVEQVSFMSADPNSGKQICIQSVTVPFEIMSIRILILVTKRIKISVSIRQSIVDFPFSEFCRLSGLIHSYFFTTSPCRSICRTHLSVDDFFAS